MVSGFGPTAGAAIASHMDVDKVFQNFILVTNVELSYDMKLRSYVCQSTCIIEMFF